MFIVGLDIINVLRKQKGLTVEELSIKSGVPIGTLNKIISGTTKDPKLDTLRALASALNCSLDDFNDTKRELIFDSETDILYQEIFEKYGVVFDKSKKTTPETLRKMMKIFDLTFGDNNE